MTVLIVLVIWLIGKLLDLPAFGGDGEATYRYEGLTAEENKLVVLVEKYRDELLNKKAVTVKAAQASVDISPARAHAPVNYEELESYLADNGKDTSLVGQYRSILASKGIPEYNIDEEYIKGRLAELVEMIDTGFDSYYEVGSGQVTIYRGKPHTVIDIDQVLTLVNIALKTFNYGEIKTNTWTVDPAEPDWTELNNAVYVAPQDAKYEYDENGAVRLVAHAAGVGIDLDLIKQELENDSWDKKTYSTHVIQPEITTENIEQKYFRDVLGSKTTYYREYETSRTNNVKLATASINGYIVLPGGNFSFNNVVGERTKERGYQYAAIYSSSGIEKELGGGICQVSSTLYVATLYANLKQVSRNSHMYTVTYVDYGLDATVYWGSIDYVFKNDTAYPIKIAAECKNGELTVKILGTKTDDISVKLRTQIIQTYEPEIIEELDETIPPGDRQVVQKGITGYKVETYKTVTINGVAQPEGRISTSTYKKLDEKVKVGPPVETTASQDETTASDPVSTENPEPPAEG